VRCGDVAHRERGAERKADHGAAGDERQPEPVPPGGQGPAAHEPQDRSHRRRDDRAPEADADGAELRDRETRRRQRAAERDDPHEPEQQASRFLRGESNVIACSHE
jgi:hypothetical protein